MNLLIVSQASMLEFTTEVVQALKSEEAADPAIFQIRGREFWGLK